MPRQLQNPTHLTSIRETSWNITKNMVIPIFPPPRGNNIYLLKVPVHARNFLSSAQLIRSAKRYVASSKHSLDDLPAQFVTQEKPNHISTSVAGARRKRTRNEETRNENFVPGCYSSITIKASLNTSSRPQRTLKRPRLADKGSTEKSTSQQETFEERLMELIRQNMEDTRALRREVQTAMSERHNM